MAKETDNESTSMLEQGIGTPAGVAGALTPGEEAQAGLDVKNDAQRQREYFASEEMIEVYVPESSDLNNNGVVPGYAFVQINGVTFNLECGTRVSVPKTVADVVNWSLAKEKEAKQRVKELSANSGKILMTIPSRQVGD